MIHGCEPSDLVMGGVECDDVSMGVRERVCSATYLSTNCGGRERLMNKSAYDCGDVRKICKKLGVDFYEGTNGHHKTFALSYLSNCIYLDTMNRSSRNPRFHPSHVNNCLKRLGFDVSDS